MEVELYRNPRTGEPHCLDHGVTEQEVLDVLDDPVETRGGDDGATIASGQTREGRWLRVIYRERPGRIFVITAFPPGPRTLAGTAPQETQTKTMNQQQLPEGWDEARIEALIAHYENQSDEEAAAEDEAYWAEHEGEAFSVPRPLVPAIEAIIREYETAKLEAKERAEPKAS